MVIPVFLKIDGIGIFNFIPKYFDGFAGVRSPLIKAQNYALALS